MLSNTRRDGGYAHDQVFGHTLAKKALKGAIAGAHAEMAYQPE